MNKVWLIIGIIYTVVLCLTMLVVLFKELYCTVTGKDDTCPEWVYKCTPCYFLSGGVFLILFLLDMLYSFFNFVMNQQEVKMQPRLLSRKDVEQKLQIGYETFIVLVEYYGLPAFKIRERWKCDGDALNMWLYKMQAEAVQKRLERARAHYGN